MRPLHFVTPLYINSKDKGLFKMEIPHNSHFAELEKRENASANKIKARAVFGGSLKRISAILCNLLSNFINLYA